MLETESKQSIVDMLQIADRPSMQDLIQRKFVADWKVPTIDKFDDANKLGTSSYAPYMVVNGVAYNGYDNAGTFPYNSVSPFGFNGAFYYAKLSFKY